MQLRIVLLFAVQFEFEFFKFEFKLNLFWFKKKLKPDPESFARSAQQLPCRQPKAHAAACVSIKAPPLPSNPHRASAITVAQTLTLGHPVPLHRRPSILAVIARFSSGTPDAASCPCVPARRRS
jgi:hypothetical protein